MCLIRKLPFMLSFYEHSAVRICCGDRLFCRFSAAGILRIVVVIVLDRLLPQLFALCIDLPAKLTGVDLRCLSDLLLLELLLIGTGLDVRTVDEDHARIDHPVIERLVENMFKNFADHFIREALAEGVTHRCEVRDLLQQPISKEPAVRDVHLYFPVRLPQRRDPEQVLDQHHLDQYHRVDPRTAVVMAVIWRQQRIQPLVIHDPFDLPQQMILRHQRLQIHDHRLTPCIFPSFFHFRTSLFSLLYQISRRFCGVF